MPNFNKNVNFDDLTAWMAGEADEGTRAAIAGELDDPTSPTSRHLAWQADPSKPTSLLPPKSWLQIQIFRLQEYVTCLDVRSLGRIAAVFAASLLIGVIGLLARQQVITGRNLAQSHADLELLREQNAAIASALAANESENAHLRRQAADAEASLDRRLRDITGQLAQSHADLELLRGQNATTTTALAARERETANLRRQVADAEVLERRLQDVNRQLEALRKEHAWPPSTFLLTGKGSTKEGQSEIAIDFLAELRRTPEGPYVGFFLPIGKNMALKPLEARGEILGDRRINLRIMNANLAWPELTKPDRGEVDKGDAERTSQSARLNIDIRTGIFEGSIGRSNVRGKITF